MTGLIFAGACTQSLRAGVITNAGLGGFGTYTVSGFALAAFQGVDMIGLRDPDFATASAHAIGSTDGPVRDGFIEISGGGGGEFGNGSGAVGNFSFGCADFCLPGNLGSGLVLPFVLGVPFQIQVGAYASKYGGGSGQMNFQFSLFESFVLLPGHSAVPGNRVIIYDPDPGPTVPEPSSFGYLGIGAALLTLRVRWPKRWPNVLQISIGRKLDVSGL